MITGTRYRLSQEIHRQQKLAGLIDRGMVEISTGKRIQTPSDDPVGAARVSDIARLQSNIVTWKSNLQTAAAISQRADDALEATATAVTRAKELMISATTGTLSDANRATIALELRSIAEEIATLQGSRDSRGEPLFPVADALEIPVGEGLRVRASGTRSSVFDMDTAGGPKDLVAIITDAADAIELTDPVARKTAGDASLDELEASVVGISAAQGEQGTRGKRIDNLLDALAASNLGAEEERKGIESADVTEVIAKLQARQLTLQAAQAAFARINASTLFDILR
jgi:flagellar hook-associated protein 3 FlgL